MNNEEPMISETNEVISNFSSLLFAPLKYKSNPDFSIIKASRNLIPFPRLHFV